MLLLLTFFSFHPSVIIPFQGKICPQEEIKLNKLKKKKEILFRLSQSSPLLQFAVWRKRDRRKRKLIPVKILRQKMFRLVNETTFASMFRLPYLFILFLRKGNIVSLMVECTIEFIRYTLHFSFLKNITVVMSTGFQKFAIEER